MYKNAKDKGITLVSLVVTVVILLILSTIAYETGKGTIESARLSAYRAEMTIMQEEVDKFEQNIRQGNITESALTQYGQNPTEVEGATEALQNAGITNAEDQSGYKYYSAEALKQLGIENVENDFLINIAKRSVVSVNGVKYHGEKYYTLSEVPGGKYIVENQPIESSVTFDATSDVQGNGMKIIISNITYIGNVKKGSIYYRHEEDEAGKWIRVKNETTDTSCTIDVLREGTYQVKVVPTTDREEKNVVPVEVPVYQANYVIAETGTKYVTLAEAFREATSGQTITQTRNCADSSTATVDGKSVTLNTNGRTITKKQNAITVNSGATLTITGNGGIKAEGDITLITNNGTLTIGDAAASLSTSSPTIQGGTYGVNTTGTFNFYNGSIKGTTDAFNTTPTAVREDYEVITGTETISGTTYKTATLGVSTITVNAPTNLAVSTGGIVTWTNSGNATGYQISIDGTNYTDATSGIDYLSTITETAGEKTIYVKAINSDTENYESTNASIATTTVTVYTVNFESNDTSKGTVSPTSKNVIAGATYTVSGNTLTLEGITTGTTTTTLATVTATASAGCGLIGWSSTSGNIITDTTITTLFTEANYSVDDTTITASLAEAIAAASDGSTIKLLRDYTDTSTATINKNVTLDLQTYTLTRDKTITVSSGANATITGSTGSKLTTGTSSVNAITNNGGTLNVGDSTATISTTNPQISGGAYGVYNNSGKWTYNNGTLQGTTSSFYDGDVETNGGLEGGVRTDYIIVTGESGNYKTAHLEKMTDVTTPWLPAGASYTNTDLNTGVTIKDSHDNEWTWVVVPKTITASASTIGANEDPTGSALEIALMNYAATVVTNRGSSYTDTWVSEAQSGFTSDEYTSKKRNMLNGIKANGGFWIGKYEMGYLDTPTSSNYTSTSRIAVVQKDAYPYNYITLPNSALKTEQLAMQAGGDGSLLFGTQWDLTIGYLVNRGGVSKSSATSNSTNWGNYRNKELTVTASTTKTGWPMGWKDTYNWTTYIGTKSSNTSKRLSTGAVEDVTNKLNIVDLAGNANEWTMEVYSTNGGTYRGRHLPRLWLLQSSFFPRQQRSL